MAFYSQEVLQHMGFKYLGKDVKISDKCSIYNPQHISIGDYSRIDDFAILSAGWGEIKIGKFVHIACHTSVIGQANITFEDYSGISSRVAIYSSSDNYDGEYMTNPCVPIAYVELLRNTYHKPVYLGKHVVVGTGSTILPGVILEDGCAVGAMSLVNKSFAPNSIIVGIPARLVKQRKENIYELCKYLEN
jgi:dTDP-4-amino-4,6-dideoxy-D-glucose acyltransferase